MKKPTIETLHNWTMLFACVLMCGIGVMLACERALHEVWRMLAYTLAVVSAGILRLQIEDPTRLG